MAYLTESAVRAAAKEEIRVAKSHADANSILKESVETASANKEFDVFLCHSIRDAEIVLGAKKLLEHKGLSVYVDWIVDPKMDRSSVSPRTASILRNRMQSSRSLFYLYSENSSRSRWMPWELGFFDGNKGAVAIIPVEPDGRSLDYSKEEYLGLYPKVELQESAVWINKTSSSLVPASDKDNYRTFENWVKNPGQLRM